MGHLHWAPAAYRQLHGIICVYKPAGLPTCRVIEVIKGNLTRACGDLGIPFREVFARWLNDSVPCWPDGLTCCGHLNALPCYRLEARMRKVDVGAELTAPVVADSSSVCADDMLEHRLVLGQRYIPSDIHLRSLHPLCRHSSGLALLGVGRGISELPFIALSRFLRVYHVKGRFGWATSNFSPKGKIIERTSFKHISREKLDKLCASVQSSHLRNMFKYAGVDPHSQEAFELAVTGLVRPADGKTPPMLYSVKCIDLQLPNFTLEVHSINEDCDYFREVIHDMGLQMKSTAICTGIRRLRYGHFDLSRALLRKHWTLEHIIDNLHQNRSLLKPGKMFPDIAMQDAKQIECGQSRKPTGDGERGTDTHVSRRRRDGREDESDKERRDTDEDSDQLRSSS